MPTTEALNVTELREQWEPDGVWIAVEAVDNWARYPWYLGVGLTPAVFVILGAALQLGTPAGVALGTGLGMVAGTVWLAGMAVSLRWLARDDVVLGHDRRHLQLGPFRVPLHDVVDLRWSGRHLRARDRSGEVYLSPAVRVRDRERVLRILRAALPDPEERDELERAREAAVDQLTPLRSRG